MNTLSCAFWGTVGGLLVEAVELAGAIKRTGRWPWRYPGEPRIGLTLTAVSLRALAGGALAAALAVDDQIGGSFAALTVGISAPLVIQKLARQVPVYLPTVVGTGETRSGPYLLPNQPRRNAPDGGAPRDLEQLGTVPDSGSGGSDES